MTVDVELLASIASGGLGQWVEDRSGKEVYVKSDDCIGCLKDLQRFFRDDDPRERPAFFAVHKYNLARSDLVPLIVTYPEEYDVVYNALKVCTFMTMPSMVAPEESINLVQQAEHVQRVREAFLAQDALAVVVGLLAEPLARHPRMREEDIVMVQLVITFLRNLVAVPAPPAPSTGSNGGAADAHRRIKRGLLDRLFADNVMDLLLLLAQHARSQPFRSEAPILVETFLNLLRDLDPEQLLAAEEALRAEQAQQAQLAEQAAKQAEAQQQQQQRRRQQQGRPAPGGAGAPRLSAAPKLGVPRLPQRPSQAPLVHLPKMLVGKAVAQNAPSRHARSDAVFVRRHTDHDRNIVLRHNPAKTELPQLPGVTNRRQAQAERNEAARARPQLGAALLVRMRGFLEAFLEGGYCILMGQVFKEVQPGLGVSRLNHAEFLHFAELATLATRYVRVKEERQLQQKQKQEKEGGAAAVAQQAQRAEEGEEGQEPPSPFTGISATMGWDVFYWGLKLWLSLSEGTRGSGTKDRELVVWQLQHASVPLLKEMLLALDLARVVGNPSDRRAADRLQRRLLHDDLKESGLLPVLSRLIREYNYRYQPRSHAVDLVETLHVVLGMLDRLNATEAGGFRVRREARPKPQTAKKPPRHATPQIEGGEQEQQEEGAGDQGSPRQQHSQQQEEEAQQGQEDCAMGEGEGEQPQACSSPAAAAAAAAAAASPEGKRGDSGEVASPGRAAGPAHSGSQAMVVEGTEEGAGEKPGPDPGSPVTAAGSGQGTPAPAPSAARAAPQAPPATGLDADCISIAGTPAGAGGRGGAAAASPPTPATARRAGGKAGAGPLDEDDEEEAEAQQPQYREVSFDVVKRVRQECAHPVIVHFYSWLLQQYRANSPFTNHALASFLARIADPRGLNLEPMLYQMSVLRVFHAILDDASIRRQSQFDALRALCTRVVRNLFARLVPDLSGLHLKAQEAREAAEHAAAVGDTEGDSAGMSAEEAGRALKSAELEIELRSQCASMGFVELLFWKNAAIAEDVRDEYNWKKLVDPPEPRGQRRQRGRGGGDGGGGSSGNDSDGGLLGFGGAGRAARKPPVFDEERAEQLRSYFERCNGRKECLDLLVHEFGGMFKKSQISRQLKLMGLQRGKFTPRQEELLRTLYEQNKDALDCFDLLAEELGAGFSASLIRRRLKKLGVVAAKQKKRQQQKGGRGKQAVAWDALGDDDSSGDEARPAAAGSSPELGSGFGGGSDSSDAGSDSDAGANSGFESAKSDLDGGSGSDSEGGGLQGLSKALGGGAKARKPRAGSPVFGTWAEEDADSPLALGTAGRPDLGSEEFGPWGSEEAGPAAAAGAAAGDTGHKGRGAAGSESPSLGAAPSSKAQPAAAKGAARGRLRKAGGALGKRPAAVPAAGLGSDSDGEAGGGGGGARASSFVTLGSDSDEDQQQWQQQQQQQQEQLLDDAATQELGLGPSSGGKKQKKVRKAAPPPAAAAAGGTGSGRKRERQQAQREGSSRKKAKPKTKPAAAPAPSSGSESEGEDAGGFVSAGESEPEAEPSPAAKVQQQQGRKAAGKRQRAAAAAAADSGSSDDDAPLWSPQPKPKAAKAQQAQQQARPAAGAAGAGKENTRAAGGKGGGKELARKRKASAEEGGGVQAQRAAALEQLRRKRQGGSSRAAGEEAEAELPPATEPFGEWVDPTERQPLGTGGEAAPRPAGRRLLRKAGGGAAAEAAGAAPMSLEDLEDF